MPLYWWPEDEVVRATPVTIETRERLIASVFQVCHQLPPQAPPTEGSYFSIVSQLPVGTLASR